MRYQAAAIANAQTALDGRLIWSYATDQTIAETGLTPDMDDSCSGTLRDIEGVEVAVFFKSVGNPDETRVSMRSNAPYDVAKICGRLGGGGHARAAGVKIASSLQVAIKRVLDEIKREMIETDQQIQG
jgi:phosphoesterase RecJ-like protein